MGHGGKRGTCALRSFLRFLWGTHPAGPQALRSFGVPLPRGVAAAARGSSSVEVVKTIPSPIPAAYRLCVISPLPLRILWKTMRTYHRRPNQTCYYIAWLTTRSTNSQRQHLSTPNQTNPLNPPHNLTPVPSHPHKHNQATQPTTTQTHFRSDLIEESPPSLDLMEASSHFTYSARACPILLATRSEPQSRFLRLITGRPVYRKSKGA